MDILSLHPGLKKKVVRVGVYGVIWCGARKLLSLCNTVRQDTDNFMINGDMICIEKTKTTMNNEQQINKKKRRQNALQQLQQQYPAIAKKKSKNVRFRKFWNHRKSISWLPVLPIYITSKGIEISINKIDDFYLRFYSLFASRSHLVWFGRSDREKSDGGVYGMVKCNLTKILKCASLAQNMYPKKAFRFFFGWGGGDVLI